MEGLLGCVPGQEWGAPRGAFVGAGGGQGPMEAGVPPATSLCQGMAVGQGRPIPKVSWNFCIGFVTLVIGFLSLQL